MNIIENKFRNLKGETVNNERQGILSYWKEVKMEKYWYEEVSNQGDYQV